MARQLHQIPRLFIYGTVGTVWGLLLFQLPQLEIQPYDEGYYALRAKAVVNFGCWLDQSQYAIGGFYSASHPPLYIWLAALAAKVLGLGEMALRLPSWVVGVLFLITLTKVAAYSDLPRVPLYALLNAGLLPLLLWYARLAQLDMLVMWLSLLQVYFYQRYLRSGNVWYAAAAGVALGAALMTKVLVGLFPALAIGLIELYRLWRKQTALEEAGHALGLFYAIGIVLGSVWFVWIGLEHEEYWVRYVEWFITDRMQRNQTLSAHRTGNLYYLNVVLTRYPLAALSVVWFWKWWQDTRFRTLHRLLWLVWLILTFGLLSLAQTKLLWYALLFLPPLLLITAESLAILLEERGELRMAGQVALSAVCLAAIWSLLQPVHRKVWDMLTGQIWLAVPSLAALLWGSVAMGMLLRKLWHRALVREALVGLLLAVGSGISLGSVMSGLSAVQTYHGAKQAADAVQQLQPACVVHLVPARRMEEKSFNPQFSYYFNGLDVNAKNWGIAERYVYLPVSAQAEIQEALAAVQRCAVVIEKTVLPEEGLKYKAVDELLPYVPDLNLKRVLDTPNYAVYAKMGSESW